MPLISSNELSLCFTSFCSHHISNNMILPLFIYTLMPLIWAVLMLYIICGQHQAFIHIPALLRMSVPTLSHQHTTIPQSERRSYISQHKYNFITVHLHCSVPDPFNWAVMMLYMIWCKLLQNSVKVESLKISHIFLVKNLFAIAY
jgi:hypothetical protein